MEIHRIPVRGTNCYLLRDQGGTVLVDPGPPGGAALVLAGAQAAGVGPEEIRLILVTHGHLDHYGALAEVKAWCGAPVAAHPAEPPFSQDRRNALPPAGTLRGSVIRWLYLLLSPLTHFVPLRADLLLDEGADLSSYGIEAQVVVLPGHSPATLGLLTAGGEAFVGDQFVNYSRPSQPMYLLDRAAWRRSCQRVLSLQPRTVYVGHGEPFPGGQLDHIYPASYQLLWWVH
jgi:glyoxylase-like metal-dependent hydrolase (beta-lactamase superfamily II)